MIIKESMKAPGKPRRRLFVVAMSLIVSGAAALSPTPAVAAPAGDVSVLADSHWWANVAGSNAAGAHKALDIKDLSVADGAVVQLWTYSGGNQQRFYHDSIGSSVIKLRNVNSGKCLDTRGPSDADGTQVHQWNCYSTDSQTWRQENAGTRIVNGSTKTVYRFVNLFGRDTCLDNAGGSGNNNNNKIQIWTCNGSANQLWY